jgi:hypothetical protein
MLTLVRQGNRIPQRLRAPTGGPTNADTLNAPAAFSITRGKHRNVSRRSFRRRDRQKLTNSLARAGFGWDELETKLAEMRTIRHFSTHSVTARYSLCGIPASAPRHTEARVATNPPSLGLKPNQICSGEPLDKFGIQGQEGDKFLAATSSLKGNVVQGQ